MMALEIFLFNIIIIVETRSKMSLLNWLLSPLGEGSGLYKSEFPFQRNALYQVYK